MPLSPFLAAQIHDLIKDSRFAKAGGADVFLFLARHLVEYGTDKVRGRHVCPD
jgi:hypothetical protein